MTNQLTRSERNSNDARKACFNSQALSISGNQRERELNHQGARSATPHTHVAKRVRPTTVATAQPGGASSSKWTRKTRPWNVSMPTTVVASFSVEAFAQTRAGSDGPKSLPNHPPFSSPEWESRAGEGDSAPRRSPGLEAPGAATEFPQGGAGGITAASSSRTHGSSVQVRLGGGALCGERKLPRCRKREVDQDSAHD